MYLIEPLLSFIGIGKINFSWSILYQYSCTNQIPQICIYFQENLKPLYIFQLESMVEIWNYQNQIQEIDIWPENRINKFKNWDNFSLQKLLTSGLTGQIKGGVEYSRNSFCKSNRVYLRIFCIGSVIWIPDIRYSLLINLKNTILI